jgi:hypothetical protein
VLLVGESTNPLLLRCTYVSQHWLELDGPLLPPATHTGADGPRIVLVVHHPQFASRVHALLFA